MDHVVPPSFLFRYRVTVPQLKAVPRESQLLNSLGDNAQLPCPALLDRDCDYLTDVHLAWHPQGLLVQYRVGNLSEPVQISRRHLDGSDGLHLLIDTRDTQSIHRAGRFCHRFAVLPNPRSEGAAICQALQIERSSVSVRPEKSAGLKARWERLRDGYRCAAWIPGDALTGWDPESHQRLGFFYALILDQKDVLTFSADQNFPVSYDPSLWSSLALSSDAAAWS